MEDKLVADFAIGSPHVSAVAFVILLLSGFSAPRCSATVYDSDGSEASVQACIRSAADGDIVTLPAGTFSWTSPLIITKGITLQGQSTITGAGTSNPAITDETIIKDDTPRSGINTRMIIVNMTPSQSFRMTGITFTHGAATQRAASDGAFHFVGTGNSPVTNCRIDHCHFDSLNQTHLIHPGGWNYGVADHNVFHLVGQTFPFYITHAQYGGTSQINGNGAWADYPWFGTEKFFFIEDNTVIRTGLNYPASLADAIFGGRYVIRHNYVRNAIPNNHGTEAGPPRGSRAYEVYDNTFEMTVKFGNGGQRSGTSLWHDNTFIGNESTTGNFCALANVRETPARAHPSWGIADGTSVWDKNDTEGNGTFVEGHAPFLFASGTATAVASGTGTGPDYVFTVSGNPGWTTDQWAGYSIKNPSASTAYGSYIRGNTANTISYYHYADPFVHGPEFAVGDTFQIHRVLAMMDQNGSGKGDQLTGQPIPINTVTGRASHNHQALEPCYSWNNIYTPNGHVLGYGVPRWQPTTKLNVDFFNLGAGFPADSTPSQVSSRYKAALNGVDYVGTFVYPHPLVSGNPPAAQHDTRSQQPHWRKKEESKRAKKKRRPKTGRRVTWLNALLLTTCVSSLANECSPTNGSTHESACFNPDSHL